MSLINYWKTRGLLGIGAVAAANIGLAAAKLGGVPAAGVEHASLLMQPAPGLALGVAAGALVLAAAVGTVIAGRVRADAGVFCGLFAWLAMSWRAGMARDVMFAAPAGSTYVTLAVEVGVLAVVLGLVQVVVSALVARGVIGGDESRDGIEAPSAGVGELILAVLCTAGVYVLVGWFLVATDLKQQALLGVGVAGFAAAAVVHQVVVPTAPAWVFWVGALLGAAASFAYASTVPGVPGIGEIAIPLARALPLDHASAGAGAAVLGYWYSRRWKRAAEMERAMAGAGV